jgi:hypothetical protein
VERAFPDFHRLVKKRKIESSTLKRMDVEMGINICVFSRFIWISPGNLPNGKKSQKRPITIRIKPKRINIFAAGFMSVQLMEKFF